MLQLSSGLACARALAARPGGAQHGHGGERRAAFRLPRAGFEDGVMTKTGRAPALKVALAGAGMISWYHLTAWRHLGERVELVAVCDPNEGKARSRAQEFGIAKIYAERDAMLAGEAIDALDVATPRETHGDWVEAAAMRGIDV